MLCEACQEIFSRPRKLSYGTYYNWNQTRTSFLSALTVGCHLCCLIEENRSYSGRSDIEQPFPYEIRYSFKALNRDWARHGNGPKWAVPQISSDSDEEMELAMYQLAVESDPTPNNLGHLLATDSDDLLNSPSDFWLVFELYGPGAHLVLPLEFAARDRLPKLEQIAQRELIRQQSSGSIENLQLANTWLNNCKHNHLSCKPQKAERWLPTRLLYIGSQNIPALRLILSSSISVESEYAALSHRWGTNKGFVLTLANRAQYLKDIPASNLSSTLQDAVHITRGLGLQYLWADSMCIVQDDENDWASESATMSRVYGLSTCTIAAANSGSGDAGCFATRNPYRVRPCIIPNPFKTDSKYSFYVRSLYLHQIHQREVKNSLWYSRGWVFQERTLSRRLLIFGETQMLWACGELQAAEIWPCGKTSKNFIDQFESFEVERARFHALLDQSKGIATDNKTWSTFIQDYTGAKLTRNTDRLVALQGLATQVEGLTGQQYCAGFWLNDNLPSSLLWAAAQPPFPYPQEYRAPSWSWASVDGSVNFNHDRFEGITVIQVLGTQELSDHPHAKHTGNRKVPRVALHLSGKLLCVVLVKSTDGTSARLMTHRVKAKVPEPLNPVRVYRQPSLDASEPGSSKPKEGVNFPQEGLAVNPARRSTSRGLLKCFVFFKLFCSVRYLQEKRETEERVIREQEIATQKELAHRRGQVEKWLALIGTPGWQDSIVGSTTPMDQGEELEQWTESLLVDNNLGWAAKFFYDAPLHASQSMEMFVLPVIEERTKWAARVQGLLVRPVNYSPDTNYYQRIGMFEMSRIQLLKFTHTPKEEGFFLI